MAVAAPASFMMRAVVDGRVVEGQPLVWSKSQVMLMGRDGALVDLDPAVATGAKKIGDKFVGYTSAEMAASLRAEFGRDVEIATTGHFVAVQPKGVVGPWGERLEMLYRGFVQYVAVRGFAVRQPAVPLAAIVFPNAEAYRRHAAAMGTPVQSGTMGHYDPVTNRIYLFDATGMAGGDWSVNAATIIHEATHQTAYNVGVHQRLAEQPRWAVEGLAMMFEARGVWNAASIHKQADRINRERLDCFRDTAASRGPEWVADLVAGDAAFDSDALRAYAESWMATFYLCETQPQAYAAYLARMAERPLFSKYDSAARRADFTALFGGDFTLLGAQITRFAQGLP
jgi:hypothetical protein